MQTCPAPPLATDHASRSHASSVPGPTKVVSERSGAGSRPPCGHEADTRGPDRAPGAPARNRAGPGFQPERLREGLRPCAVERYEGIVLSSEGVEAAHEQRPCPLSPGFSSHQPFELRNRRWPRRRRATRLRRGPLWRPGATRRGGHARHRRRRHLRRRCTAFRARVPRLLHRRAGHSGRCFGKLGAGGLDTGDSNCTASTAAGSM